MNKVYNFPWFLSWAQESTNWLEFFELIIIGLVFSSMYELIIAEGGDNFSRILMSLEVSIYWCILLFLWWKLLRWVWSIKWIIILASISSLGLSLILYLIIYSIVWSIAYLNCKFVLIHFYTGGNMLSYTKYDPFESAFSDQDGESKGLV